MRKLPHLFEQNKKWSSEILSKDPEFFKNLSKQQAPEYLWIGCSDSRVPASEIVKLAPGELFVHRNVANVICHSDMNCLSVLQYAVDILKVKHIIVCGHDGCGGVRAAMEDTPHGLVDNWIRNVRDLYLRNKQALSLLDSDSARTNQVCEWNVFQQVYNVGHTTIVQDAWAKGTDLTIHGWFYTLGNGLLKEFDCCVCGNSDLESLEIR